MNYKTITTEELQEFYDELESHDWFYHYSDSGSAFSKGASNETRLHEKAQTHPELRKLYASYRDYKNSKGALLKPGKPSGN